MGNMEVDALLAHGISYELNTRMTKCCDEFFVYICNSCGHLLNSYNNTCCQKCENGVVEKTMMPYISKLIFQELNAMLIETKISIVE